MFHTISGAGVVMAEGNRRGALRQRQGAGGHAGHRPLPRLADAAPRDALAGNRASCRATSRRR